MIPNAWRVKYPKITSKIDELEDRIKKLSSKMKKVIQIDKGHKFTLTQIDLAKVDLTKFSK